MRSYPLCLFGEALGVIKASSIPEMFACLPVKVLLLVSLD